MYRNAIVIDSAFDLMWQQRGSSKPVAYNETEKLIGGLSQIGFGAVNNWRFPTREEAKSLLKP